MVFQRHTVLLLSSPLPKLQKQANLFLLSPHLSLLKDPETHANSSPTLAYRSPEDSILKIIPTFPFHTSQSPHFDQKEKKNVFKIPLHENESQLGNVGRQGDNLIYLLTCHLVSLFLNMIVQQTIVFTDELSLNRYLVFLRETIWDSLSSVTSNKTMPSVLCHPLRI